MKNYNFRLSNWALLLLVISNIAILAYLLWSHQGPKNRKGPPDPMRMVHFLKKELQLDNRQVEAFTQLRQQHFEKTRLIRKEIRQNKERMITTFTSLEADQEKAKEIAQTIGQLQTNLEKELISHFADLKKVCSPDQQKKLGQVFTKALKRGPPPLLR